MPDPTSATLGSHTLVATQSLTDANAANNQGSAAVTVVAPSTDVAVTGVTAPVSVLKGNTATIGVTVQNVGGLNVGSFNVVLTDATAGVTIGSQSVPSLAVNAATTRSFSWNTATAALGGEIGLPIVTPALGAAARLAEELGGAAKPSGAGGGDVGVAFLTDRGAAETFRQRAPHLGLEILSIRTGADGLRREPSVPERNNVVER